MRLVRKALWEGTEGPQPPLDAIVSTGFAGRAGRFRPLPKSFLAFFTAVSLWLTVKNAASAEAESLSLLTKVAAAAFVTFDIYMEVCA